jgi:hypothetical protein
MNLKSIALPLLAFGALTGQSPAPSAAPGATAAAHAAAAAPHPHVKRHIVYQFGYNTKVADKGDGTGTTTIDVQGTAPDGGTIVKAQDNWWMTSKPRAWNTCEVYADGGVACLERPFAISPIQVTIFSLLGQHFFSGLSGGNHATWHKKYTIKAAIVPGGNAGFSGNLYTWKCDVTLTGKGHGDTPNSPIVVVQMKGKMSQEGGRYLGSDITAGIAYDPRNGLPAFVSETRAKLPQTSIYNKDDIQLKLLKITPGH